MMGSCRNMFQEPYFPAWIFPLSHPLAEVAAEIQGILLTLRIRFCLSVEKSIGELFMASNKWAALLCLRVDNYDFDLKLLRLHRVCLFNPKGAVLTFDFPQISKEIESNAHVHQVAISPISRFLKGHFTCAKISTVEYRFLVLGLVCSAGVFWAAESCLFMFVLLFFDSPHFLPSFRVLTCAFAIKTFARPKKTPALQVNLGLRIRMGQERVSPGETSQAKRSEEKRLFSIQKLSLKYFFFLVEGQNAKKLQMSHDKKDGK